MREFVFAYERHPVVLRVLPGSEPVGGKVVPEAAAGSWGQRLAAWGERQIDRYLRAFQKKMTPHIASEIVIVEGKLI